ncbi:hypothetical protein [Pseudonocardia abyssalis]|jgi:hypothetical protein|uniref:ABC transporter permease n=1 Tax=Pseudonocardia abyssalis TaxID=2792008 RepID=A0ABS6UTE9_9PSEU|nr:hypothetical protein [Pseudonocardia abyssalis]MBW0117414.1 hypothetical protein [Pseudonocardia abyssalis]MBW0135532.1 hypothetical protein [Pseudonocardia abyssalis]
MTTVRSETIKFTSVRSLPVLAGAAVLAAVATALLFLVSLPVTQGATAAELTPAEVLGVALLGLDAAALVLVVAAASFAGSEYATGLVQATHLLTPRRGRVLVAKAVVVTVVATGVAAVAAVLCVLVGTAFGGGFDLRPVAGSALTPVFQALVALAAATALRSTGGGVVAALVLIASPTVAGWIPGVDLLVPLLPTAALHGISGAEGGGALPGALSLLAWLGVLGSLALHRLRTRDV